MKKIIIVAIAIMSLISSDLLAVAKNLESMLKKKYSTFIAYPKEKHYLVCSNGKWGACSLSGKVVIPCIYESVSYRGQGFVVENNGKFGMCDRFGKEIISCRFDGVYYDLDGYIDVSLDSKHGLYSSLGKELVPCEYDSVIISDKYRTVKKDGLEGLYDKNWKNVVPCKFKTIYYEEKDKCYHTVIDEKQGLFNENGEELLECKYDIIYLDDSSMRFYVKLNDKAGVFDLNGKEFIPCLYDSASYNKEDKCYHTSIGEKRGLISGDGGTIFDCKYDLFYLDSSKIRYSVTLNNKKGVFDLTGKELIPCLFDSIFDYNDHYDAYVGENKIRYDVKGDLLVASEPINKTIKLSGTWRYKFDFQNRSIRLTGDKIENQNIMKDSGPIRLRLYLTNSVYTGGDITGYVIAEYMFNPLKPRYYYSNIDKNLGFITIPPDGDYYLTLCLCEEEDRLMVKDYVNFDNQIAFNNSPGFLDRLTTSLNMINGLLNKSNTNNTVPYVNQNNVNSNVYRGHMENVKCSFCNGTGENPAEEHGPNFGLENTSHYHKVCPSCMGKGYIRKYVP
jgi:hypothetical protein